MKFDNAELNKEEFHTSKQPIALNLVNLNHILMSDKFEHSDTGCNISSPAKIIISLYCYVLFYLILGDTWNILKTKKDVCLLWLKMMVYRQNIMKFKVNLKGH